jgi:uncharacterized protein YdaU (DUF1376 family)
MNNNTSPSLSWMPWYCGDYVARTRHLTLQQRGALMDLTAMTWLCGPLPSDPARLASMIGVNPTEFRRIWPAICSWFQDDGNGQLIQPDLEARRLEAVRIYEARAQAGRQSAQKRRGVHRANGQANGHDDGAGDAR